MSSTLSKCDISLVLDALTTASIGGGLSTAQDAVGYPGAYNILPVSNAIYRNKATITTSPTSIDLTGGTITNAFGTVLNFATVYGLLIANLSTTAGQNLNILGNFITVKVLGSTAGPIKIPPSGCIWLVNSVDGYPVTAGTGDIISLSSSSGSLTADIFVIGLSSTT